MASRPDASRTQRSNRRLRLQRVAFRSSASLFAAAWLFPFFGLIDVAFVVPTGGTAPTPENVDGLLSIAYGTVATFILPPAFLAHLWAPRGRPAAIQQVAAVAVAFGAAGCLGLDPRSLLSVAILVVMEAFLLTVHAGHRPPLLPDVRRVSRTVLIVAVIGIVPWLAYAWQMSTASRAGLFPEEVAARPEAGGWAGAAVLAFASVLLPLLAATGTPGWPLPLWTTAVSVAIFGVVVTLSPALAGSPGRVWGVLATVWAVSLLVAAYGGPVLNRKRPRPGPRPL